ncbi:MAG: ABC transporter ATP-binding protein [Bacteroidaceae bacterium]|nr:ABC transporter ATP-binding protein [Bacteroidaceae bacterium]MBQ9176803.1 ABC transporter ATP-binding protein [Bacteroidaceae bacterium]
MKLNRTKQSTRRIVSWLWNHHRGCRMQAIINMVVGLVQVVLSLYGVELLRQLTDIATGKREGELLATAAIYIAVMMCDFLCNASHTWISAVLGVRSQNQMQQHFFSRLLKARWQGIERYHSGDVMNRLFGDVADIVNLMTEVLPFIVVITTQFLASFIYLFIMDRTLAYILVVCSPVFLILSRIYFRKMRRIVRKVKDSNSSVQAIIQESIQHKMVIKVMEMTDEMVRRLERRQSLLRWQIKCRARLSILTRTIVFVGFRGGALVALTYGLWQVSEGAITVGVLLAFTQLINKIQHPLLDLGRILPTLVGSFTSSERLMELEALPQEDDETTPPAATSRDKMLQPLTFTNVNYSYTDSGRPVLQGFSHSFMPGSFTAVLGETGAGKTTMLRLMLHLITPQSGTISPRLPRSAFSYVPQGNTLFSGTIRENLRFGNRNATTDEMYDALHIASADFVRDLPKGLDTPCGEGGGGLSEGQAQRIAIARAILRPCSILLLDEATSALDVETEKRVLTNIKQHYSDITIIFVTHRLSAVDFATEQIHMQRQG